MKSSLVPILTALFGILIGGLAVWLIITRLPSENAASTSASPLPVASLAPVPSAPAASLLPTSAPAASPTWSTYSNPVYHYELSYDPSWMLNSHPPGSDAHERVILQGDISQVGWPSINISRLKLDPAPTTMAELETRLNDLFGSSATVTTTSFGHGPVSAVKVATAASPQAYATETYYFFSHGVPLMISLNDTGSASQSVYTRFLDSFSLL